MTASDREQTVILYPKLVITGRVTDAETGRPVPKFRVVQGRQSDVAGSRSTGLRTRAWTSRAVSTPSQFDEPRRGAVRPKVEAPGYKPAVSRAFRPNEGSQTFDFALERAAGLSGIVLLPDGKPAAGVEVALATGENHVSLRSGRFDRDANFPTITTGPDGRFTFPPQDDKFLLIAVSDAGYADASSDEFAKSGKLVLQPWGRIEGGVRIGPRFGVEPGGDVSTRSGPRADAGSCVFTTTTRRRPTSGDASDSTG